jgi:hypothetical protein
MEKIMDDYTKRLFRRKIPTFIAMILVLLVGIIMRVFAE